MVASISETLTQEEGNPDRALKNIRDVGEYLYINVSDMDVGGSHRGSRQGLYEMELRTQDFRKHFFSFQEPSSFIGSDPI